MKRFLILIVQVILQFIAGYILGFLVPYFGGIGNGLELIAIPIGDLLGVWGVGTIIQRHPCSYFVAPVPDDCDWCCHWRRIAASFGAGWVSRRSDSAAGRLYRILCNLYCT
ncbi:hypothetical protein KFU94_39870 [Chloroflexi bacterium TSY]|nr:hypothetical protein [Chloroflexi bacterium TSY]